MTVRIPPPAWAALFLLIAWALGVLVPIPIPILLFQRPLGAVLAIVGFCLGLWAGVIFLRVGTELEPASESNRTLVVRGPFRFTRNPMYLGMLTTSAGIALLVGMWSMFLAPLAFFFWVNTISIPFEEAKMERQFGPAYRSYKGQVRRWV
ncbi:MAG: isoprenylcysteine carboxylmethyltransferase family protein [Devosia sp.]|nr:isoprenylcysteine carboxylmethyltransferase family protein [Devosia sp.]